jgi:hypothetical protein
MKKKLSFVLGAGALVLIMSSCFALQGFVVLDYTLTPGQATKARFTLRAMDANYKIGGRQFVIVGVNALATQDTDIAVQSATWGATGTFGGPTPMGVEANLITSMGTDCSASGLNFADITGVTWKAFATSTNKNDLGRVEVKAVVDVQIRAKAAQVDPGENYAIMGVAGLWIDDGDGNPEPAGSSDDSYICWGISTAGVYAKA